MWQDRALGTAGEAREHITSRKETGTACNPALEVREPLPNLFAHSPLRLNVSLADHLIFVNCEFLQRHRAAGV